MTKLYEIVLSADNEKLGSRKIDMCKQLREFGISLRDAKAIADKFCATQHLTALAYMTVIINGDQYTEYVINTLNQDVENMPFEIDDISSHYTVDMVHLYEMYMDTAV